MILSSFHPLTLLDYPGHTACIVFTVGCNFRCGFCHNPNFVIPERIAKIKDSFIQTEAFFAFLERRIGLLDGVVICGGEPTIHHDLEDFIRHIKSLGFQVKLDTNGSNPAILQHLIQEGLLDMVAMDIKRPIDRYSSLKTVIGDDATLPDKITESVRILDESGIPIEFRTTVASRLHTPEIIDSICSSLPTRASYAIQNFRSGDILNPDFGGEPCTYAELEALANAGRTYFPDMLIRN